MTIVTDNKFIIDMIEKKLFKEKGGYGDDNTNRDIDFA